MPRYSVEPRKTRRDRAVEQTKLDLAQQDADSAQLQDYMGYATSLYGLQQDRQAAPEKLRGMRLENDARAFENAWAQPMAEARHAATLGLAGQRNDKIGISPQEVALLVNSGIWTSEQGRQALMSPEEKATLAQTQAAAEAARQQAIAADQALQGDTATASPASFSADPTRWLMRQGVRASLPGQLTETVQGLPEFYQALLQMSQAVSNPPRNAKPIPTQRHEQSYPSYIN